MTMKRNQTTIKVDATDLYLIAYGLTILKKQRDNPDISWQDYDRIKPLLDKVDRADSRITELY